jgi:hypothetical protein
MKNPMSNIISGMAPALFPAMPAAAPQVGPAQQGAESRERQAIPPPTRLSQGAAYGHVKTITRGKKKKKQEARSHKQSASR